VLKGNTGDVADTIPEIPPPFNQDFSTNSFPITINSNARATAFNPVSGNYYSTYFDGSSSIDWALSTTGAAAFGTNDFTIELWVYPTTAPNNNWSPFLTIGTSTDGQEIRISQNINGTGWGVLFPNGASTYQGFGTLPVGVWHHIAFVRNGTSIILYRNGLVVNTWTNVTTNFTNTTLFRTGSCQPGYADGSYVGYMHGLRIIKGTALYTGAYTVPTSPLTVVTNTTYLAHNYPYYLDQGSNLAITINGTPKVTQFVPIVNPPTYNYYGSSYFDGSSYLTATITGGLGSGDFTVDGWVYFTVSPGNNGVFHLAPGSTLPSNGNGLALAAYSSPYWHIFFGGAADTQAAPTVTIGRWYHFAMSRASGSLRLFINGVQNMQTYTDATDYTASTFLAIGGYYSTGYLMSGYVSNFRIVTGTALYTSPFTVNNTLSTAISGTSFLALQYNGSYNNNIFVDKSGMNAIIVRNGDTNPGTFSPYNASYSTYFNGSTDYVTIASNAAFNQNTAFTVECFVYAVAAAGTGYFFAQLLSGYLGLQFTASGKIVVDKSYIGVQITSTGTFALSTWHHVALCYDGTTTTLYVNGTSQGSVAGGGAASGATLAIGTYLSGSQFFNGYLSNFRFSNIARYTTTFAVPIIGFVPDINTTALLFTDGKIDDISINRFAVTSVGTPKSSLISPFSPSIRTPNQGNYSTYFSSSWVVTPSSSIYNIGTGDFTIEFWFYTTSVTVNYCSYFNLGAYNTGIMYRQNYSGIEVYFVNSQIIAPSGTIAINTWYHTALTRSGTSVSLYLNGARISNVINSTSISPTSSLLIGTSAHATGEAFPGYISNLRFIIGTALYNASNLALPTSPLTVVNGTVFLGLNNTSPIDISQQNAPVYIGGGTPKIVPFSPFSSSSATVTLGSLVTPYVIAGSMYFDGTGDYLSLTANPNYALTGDYTIEMWLFPTVAVGTFRALITTGGIGSTDQLVIGTDASIVGIWSAGVISGNGVIPLPNVWTHLAVSRTGTSVYFFLNGVQQGTTKTSSSSALSGTAIVSVGYRVANGDGAFTGYIADLRVIKGRALYTTSFIPSTIPNKSTSDSVILIKGDTPGIFDSAGGSNLETFSGAKVSTNIKKFNSGSLQFNGSTDYLFIASNPYFNSGTADFTVECWVYLNALPTSDAWPGSYSTMVIIGSGTASTGDGFGCIIGQTKLLVHDNSDTSYLSTNTHSMVINTWYHLAYVRSSNTMIFYVNGTSIGSVAFSASLSSGANTFIGCETAQGAFLNGYIDDLRITRFARYTGPYFSIPTTTIQETGPSETDQGTTGLTYVAGDGLSSATAGISAVAIKAQTGTNADGTYWINLPTVGPTQVYCIMNSAVSGGGWMMAMKATRGTTFSFTSTHWTTVTTLNSTNNNRADGDAKFNTMNYYAATDIMALFPDITTNGGSLGTNNPFSCWSWLESNFNGSATTLINFFNTAGTYANGGTPSTGNYGGKFIKDAKTFSGWQSGIFSSQVDIRFYGFNFKNSGLSYGGAGSSRWGFGWNENGEGLYSSPATMATGGATGSNDVWGGIGMDSNGGSYSAGDLISCCQDTTGINRSARVEIYIR
jgi:hypothetical protein